MSQPAREFIVKVVEMSLWSSDFLLGHLLLFMLTPPILVPFIDKAHSTMLCECPFVHPPLRTLTAICLPSLAAPIKADPCSSLLDEGPKAKEMDGDQVWYRLRNGCRWVCGSHCPAYVST
jgi:hypothetical protein